MIASVRYRTVLMATNMLSAVNHRACMMFWVGVGSLFVVDRVVSAWSGGWKARLLAVLLIPELLYDMYLDVVYVKGIADITFARNAKWGHVARAPQPTTETNETKQFETADVSS